ncbi:cellulose binding domain-containing protein [Streptomyces glaucescens]|uniref:cellulose binding domain-containing protein n=1 Tax=Streptomyces glaucescens TaxID=1907 RepID=UPI001B800042|nr:cellulose binding domain-containing protein [Streptomyces glaucescens]
MEVLHTVPGLRPAAGSGDLPGHHHRPCRNTGLTSNATLTGTGVTAIDGRSLLFTLPDGRTITSGWNAVYAPASGPVTARNVAHNTTIAPGASLGIGFKAAHTGNTTRRAPTP